MNKLSEKNQISNKNEQGTHRKYTLITDTN
jgi:hypothetical protein